MAEKTVVAVDEPPPPPRPIPEAPTAMVRVRMPLVWRRRFRVPVRGGIIECDLAMTVATRWADLVAASGTGEWRDWKVGAFVIGVRFTC